MAEWRSMAVWAAAALAGAAARGEVVDQHRMAEWRFAVTNATDRPQTVESVRMSCPCLKAEDISGREIAPGKVLEFGVVFDPAGLEGEVERTAWVTLAPSGRMETFTVRETVRTRLGLKPSGAAFGDVQKGDTGRELRAVLSGYAAPGARLGPPRRLEENPGTAVFDVRLGEDGKTVSATFARQDVLPGVYAETWVVPTDDREVPELRFAASARVLDRTGVAVTPRELVVDADERGAARAVLVRGMDGTSVRVLSAATEPVAWGTAAVSERQGGGWRVDVRDIDAGVVAEFAEEPFLEIKTDSSGLEFLRIPLRVYREGVAE
ncbi:MAG: DUF1573 domain-containing protein [Kiritimatiellae bacterium]|nr:DUF1573 domain-containing protein [Kiritimatiellia bacterium]